MLQEDNHNGIVRRIIPMLHQENHLWLFLSLEGTGISFFAYSHNRNNHSMLICLQTKLARFMTEKVNACRLP